MSNQPLSTADIVFSVLVILVALSPWFFAFLVHIEGTAQERLKKIYQITNKRWILIDARQGTFVGAKSTFLRLRLLSFGMGYLGSGLLSFQIQDGIPGTFLFWVVFMLLNSVQTYYGWRYWVKGEKLNLDMFQRLAIEDPDYVKSIMLKYLPASKNPVG